MSSKVPYDIVRFEGSPEEVSAQWLEARTKGVGGSDVASIMGINKYASPLDVWMVKTGRSEGPDLSDNEAVEWGNRLEPMVADKFSELHGDMAVKRRNAMMVSRERPWAFANIDRMVTDAEGRHGVLEVKTVGSRRASDWDEGVPDYYLTQVTHYLSVTGWDFAWVAALVGGQEYREYFVPRDEEDIEAVKRSVDEFWQGFVLTDTPPACMGLPTEGSALASLYQDPSEEMLPMLDGDVPELDELASVKAEIESLDRRKRELEGGIKQRIGESKGIETPTRRVTWVRSKATRFDKKRFQADHPGLIDQYQTEYDKDGGLRVNAKKEA